MTPQAAPLLQEDVEEDVDGQQAPADGNPLERVRRFVGIIATLPAVAVKIGTMIAGSTAAAAAVAIPTKVASLASIIPVAAVSNLAGAAAVTGIAVGVELGTAPATDERIAEAEAAAVAAVNRDRELNMQQEGQHAGFDLSLLPGLAQQMEEQEKRGELNGDEQEEHADQHRPRREAPTPTTRERRFLSYAFPPITWAITDRIYGANEESIELTETAAPIDKTETAILDSNDTTTASETMGVVSESIIRNRRHIFPSLLTVWPSDTTSIIMSEAILKGINTTTIASSLLQAAAATANAAAAPTAMP